jgi:hypothetical protein
MWWDKFLPFAYLWQFQSLCMFKEEWHRSAESICETFWDLTISNLVSPENRLAFFILQRMLICLPDIEWNRHRVFLLTLVLLISSLRCFISLILFLFFSLFVPIHHFRVFIGSFLICLDTLTQMSQCSVFANCSFISFCHLSIDKHLIHDLLNLWWINFEKQLKVDD